MKLVDADSRVLVTIYDEEHEEHIIKNMSVEEMLYAYSNGCPLKEIVLCKDCKYYTAHVETLTYAHCPHMREEDYCSLGERREE